MHIKEQCQKSEDDSKLIRTSSRYFNPEEPKKINGELITEIDKNCHLSDDLTQAINEHEKILFIIDESINLQLLNTLIKIAEKKQFKIIIASYATRNITLHDYQKIFSDIFVEMHKDRFIIYDINDPKAFSFFGTTRLKSTILIHSSFVEAELIIPICEIRYNILYGVTNAQSMIFPGISHKKSIIKFAGVVIDSETDKLSNYLSLTDSHDSKLSNDSSEATLIARSDVTYFAVNYITNLSGEITDISSGDILISQINIAKLFLDRYSLSPNEKFNSAVINFTNEGATQLATYLFFTSLAVNKGGNIIVDFARQNIFIDNEFEEILSAYDTAALIEKLTLEFDIKLFTAFVLKYLASTFMIAVARTDDNSVSELLGFKTLTDDEAVKLINGSGSSIGVYNANRFAAR